MRLAIHFDRSSDHCGVAAELAAPIAVAQDHRLRAVWGIVHTREGASEQRRNSQNGKQAIGHAESQNALRLPKTGDVHRVAGASYPPTIETDVLKSAALLSKNEVG